MPASDAELLEGFVTAALPVDQFHHEQHVRVAWLFVRQHGMPAALGEFAAAIKRFADAKGARDVRDAGSTSLISGFRRRRRRR